MLDPITQKVAGRWQKAPPPVNPSDLRKLQTIARKPHASRHLQNLADALSDNNWDLADQWYQFLRSEGALHGVPDSIVDVLFDRNR